KHDQSITKNGKTLDGTVSCGGVQHVRRFEISRGVRLREVKRRRVLRVPGSENAVAVGMTNDEPTPLYGIEIIVILGLGLNLRDGTTIKDSITLAVDEIQFVLQKEVANLVGGHRRQHFGLIALVVSYAA